MGASIPVICGVDGVESAYEEDSVLGVNRRRAWCWCLCQDGLSFPSSDRSPRADIVVKRQLSTMYYKV